MPQAAGTPCGEGQVCRDGVCGVACGGVFCPAATEICVDGACRTCDVTCPSGSAAACGDVLQAALENDDLATVHVCAGTYLGRVADDDSFQISRAVNVIGAGAGKTIFDGGDNAGCW